MTTFLVPPRPDLFTPDGVAPGCRTKFLPIERDLLPAPARMLVVHTNWAPVPGTIESAYNYAMAAADNTKPHYQHDLDGDAAKMLPTNRRGLGNRGTRAYWSERGLPTADWWALVFETSDRGTATEAAPIGSYFTDEQAASLTRDLAYEAVLHDIDPVWPTDQRATGIIAHTQPWPYPAFTTASTKRCPGYRKIEQLRDLIIPWTAAIVNAWTSPDPPPPPPPTQQEDDMRVYVAFAAGHYWWSINRATVFKLTAREARTMLTTAARDRISVTDDRTGRPVLTLDVSPLAGPYTAGTVSEVNVNGLWKLGELVQPFRPEPVA